MSTFRLQKVDKIDRPPKTLMLYEEDGVRIRRHRYVCPVRCIDCKHSRVERAEGAFARTCPMRNGPVRDDGFCDKGERRGGHK